MQFQIKNLQNVLIKEVKVFHSSNSLTDSGPWNLSVNSFQTKCLIPPDNAFQAKC